MPVEEYEVVDRQTFDSVAGASYAPMTLKSLAIKSKHADDDDPGRFFSGMLNANKVDREGERFDPMGIDLSGFKAAGGPILIDHFSEILSMGRSGVVARAINTVRAPEGLIIKKAEFDTDDISEHFKGKVLRGFIRGLSAGFLRKEAELRQSKKTGEQHLFVTKSELIHAVLTSQPVSRESLLQAKSLSPRIEALEKRIVSISDGLINPESLDSLSVQMSSVSAQVTELVERLDSAPKTMSSQQKRLAAIADFAMTVAADSYKAAHPDLPDAAYCVEIGAQKNSDGTAVHGFRHLPHHTGAVKSSTEHGSVDKTLLRIAFAKLASIQPKSESAMLYRARAKAHLLLHAEAIGMDDIE